MSPRLKAGCHRSAVGIREEALLFVCFTVSGFVIADIVIIALLYRGRGDPRTDR
jgi:hypothetical protein